MKSDNVFFCHPPKEINLKNLSFTFPSPSTNVNWGAWFFFYPLIENYYNYLCLSLNIEIVY